MRAELRPEHEPELPRQAVQVCANPWCRQAVPVAGEFCLHCRDQQDRQRAAMRRQTRGLR